MNRKLRSESELKLVLEHIMYERNMLISIANGLSIGIAGKSPINNALVESFAIHVRNLVDFLWPEKPKNDHVIALDFFSDKNKWPDIRPEISNLLKKSRIRAHKEIAHLSYDRINVTKREKAWQTIEIANEIENAFKIFYSNISIK
jgi:hypothetical protein